MRTWVLPLAAVLPHARGWLRRGGALALALGLFQTLPGCTLVGGFAGSQYPKYEAVPEQRVRDLRPGTAVEVDTAEVTWVRDRVRRTATPAEPLRGKVVDNRGGFIVLRTDSGATGVVDRRYAREVKVRDGTYAGTGLLIGLFVDLAVFMAAAAAAGGFSMTSSSGGGGGNLAHTNGAR